jgi:hypothetical protein
MTKLQNRCANCEGKFGLVYHNYWGLRFCRWDDFLAETAKDHARMRKWFERAASSKERNRPDLPTAPAQPETEAQALLPPMGLRPNQDQDFRADRVLSLIPTASSTGHRHHGCDNKCLAQNNKSSRGARRLISETAKVRDWLA